MQRSVDSLITADSAPGFLTRETRTPLLWFTTSVRRNFSQSKLRNSLLTGTVAPSTQWIFMTRELTSVSLDILVWLRNIKTSLDVPASIRKVFVISILGTNWNSLSHLFPSQIYCEIFFRKKHKKYSDMILIRDT